MGGFRRNASWAFKSIKSTTPGFKNVITATGTTLYGDSWSGVSALTAFGGDVTDETATQLFNGAKVPTTNNSFDGAVVGGANSVVSGGKQYVTLIVNPAATADTIHGGVIHIERTAA